MRGQEFLFCVSITTGPIGPARYCARDKPQSNQPGPVISAEIFAQVLKFRLLETLVGSERKTVKAFSSRTKYFSKHEQKKCCVQLVRMLHATTEEGRGDF
jgi:hypothetical protein